MALILSAATGNFNAGATWVGGIVPGAADEARASTGHTVTITANVTCTELSNAGTGTFILNSGVTLTANVTNKSATASSPCLAFSAASPATASIVGNPTGGGTSGATAVFFNGTGTLTITGNATGGTSTSAHGVNNAAGGSLNFIGNALGGSGGSASGVQNSNVGNTTITGNVTAGSGGNGALNLSTGSLTITGSILATAIVGVTNSSTGTVTITGTLTPTTSAHALQCTNTTGANITLSGSLIYASNGFAPTNCAKFLMNPTPAAAKVRFAKNGSTTYSDFFTADNSLGQAAITDVRFGTVYASGALTGVAYIPAAGSVALGVPVDNTTGTATLTAADVRAAIGMASANLDTQLAAIPTAITNAAAVRTNLATELGRIDATISSRSTLTAANVRTELTPELTEIGEVHAIHGLDIANALTVTPTLRSAGAITQAITGDGTTNTIVTRV